MKKEDRLPDDHPQHYTKKALFSKHTWFRSADNREFVITFREETMEGDITFIHLLEKNKMVPVIRPYEEILNLFNEGRLTCTSKLEA